MFCDDKAPWRMASLNTSNFRQAAVAAFLCLLLAMASIPLTQRLFEWLMQSHVREMILEDVSQLFAELDEADAATLAERLATQSGGAGRRDQIELVTSADGEILYGDGARVPADLASCDDCRFDWRYGIATSPNDHHRAILLGLRVPLSDGGAYFSAYDLGPMFERAVIIPLMTGAGLLLILFTIVTLSLPFSLRKHAQAARIREALARYAAGDHTIALQGNPQGDELDRLSEDVRNALVSIDRLMEEVRTISSHVAHELRTPLTRLQGRLMTVADSLDDRHRPALLEAVEEIQHIHRLSRAVMRLAAVESGRYVTQVTEFSATALINDLEETYQPLVESHGSQLISVTAPGPLQLRGDRDLLFQALANLIDNAIRYSAASGPIELRLACSNSDVMLTVADHGPGIPVAQRERVLERFQRLAPGGSGHGLGLTLVKAIVERHGGRLVLTDNQPGLRATLALPRHTPAQAH